MAKIEKWVAQKACPEDYKQAQDLFERAVAILKHERGVDLILPSEYAALYYGFHTLRDVNINENLGTNWDLLALAAKKAMAGLGIKQGEIRSCAQSLGEAGGVDGTD